MENECAEQMVDCSNDECKEQIKRKDFETHTEQQCEERLVECSFARFGCNANNIRAKEMETHIIENQLEHISMKFDAITAQIMMSFSESIAECLWDKTINGQQTERIAELTATVSRLASDSAEQKTFADGNTLSVRVMFN